MFQHDDIVLDIYNILLLIFANTDFVVNAIIFFIISLLEMLNNKIFTQILVFKTSLLCLAIKINLKMQVKIK